MDELLRTIAEHEGLRRKLYKDTTGHYTIGYGRNLSDIGISKGEALGMLQDDIEAARNELMGRACYDNQDQVRKGVLIELVFNIGINSFLKFTNFIQYVEEKKYAAAVMDLRSTLWARQIGRERLNNMMYRLLQGTYQ